MKRLSLLILLALAPMSWGEDVYYCVEKASQGLKFNDEGSVKKRNFSEERFTLKYNDSSKLIVIAGGPFSRDIDSGDGEPMHLPCEACFTFNDRLSISAYDSMSNTMFSLRGKQFVYANILYSSVTTGAGTCTKF